MNITGNNLDTYSSLSNKAKLMSLIKILDKAADNAENEVLHYIAQNRHSLQRLTLKKIIEYFNTDYYCWPKSTLNWVLSRLFYKGDIKCTFHSLPLDTNTFQKNINQYSHYSKTFVELKLDYEKRHRHLKELQITNDRNYLLEQLNLYYS